MKMKFHLRPKTKWKRKWTFIFSRKTKTKVAWEYFFIFTYIYLIYLYILTKGFFLFFIHPVTKSALQCAADTSSSFAFFTGGPCWWDSTFQFCSRLNKLLTNFLMTYMYLRCEMSHSLTSNKRLDFGADADHDTDPGINGMLPLKDRGCSALAYISGLQLYHGLMV